METTVRTPLSVFTLPQHLMVPLFQRPYVWDEDNQWAPLWQDIRRLAEHQLARPGVQVTHFLGAVVLQSAGNQQGAIPAWSIIDGQQRMTTLQLFLDSVAAVLEVREFGQLAGQLEALTHNQSAYVQGDDVRLKLRHTNRDRAAYDEVMLADPLVDYGSLQHRSSLLVRAHRYFADRATEWLDEPGHDTSQRAAALTRVLTQSVQLVVIELGAEEDSQEIFETLNARGTPLTAADLIKNFVFQRLEAEGVDMALVYPDLWPFESKFWEKEISVGRNLVSRGSVFLNQWLVSRVGDEVGPKATFSRFRHYVEHEAGQSMSVLLAVIKQQAGRYQTWTERANDPGADLDRVELCVYRSQSAGIEALKPILLWLTEPDSPYSTATVDRVVGMIESWFVRRMLLRLPLGDLGRVVAELTNSSRGAEDATLVSRVESSLRSQNAVSTYWPGDEELRSALATEAAYSRFRRGRLRMFLEAAEDHYRGYTGESASRTGVRVPRLGFPIEHLLPRAWHAHWPVPDLAAEVDRDAHVHRLGNLTLITNSLNSSVSNGPWLGEKGKRTLLDKHDVLLMNRRIHDMSAAGWSEGLIDARTGDIVDALLATWPVPEGHQGTINDKGAPIVAEVSVKELVAAGLLEPGMVLRPRSGEWGDVPCTVLASGDLEIDRRAFNTPSGAGHHVRKNATNGWWFWELPDGRRLKDVRAEYQARPPAL